MQLRGKVKLDLGKHGLECLKSKHVDSDSSIGEGKGKAVEVRQFHAKKSSTNPLEVLSAFS